MPLQPFASVTFTVIGKLPTTVGVPERTPPLDRVRPVGNEPLFSVNVAVPTAPVCVKLCENAAFAVAVVVAGLPTLMMLQTVRVKFWSVEPTAFVARKMSGYVPPVPLAGVPEIFPVPLPATAEKVTPLGSAPLCFVTVTAGFTGVVVTLKLPNVPTVKVVLFALVKAGLTGGGPAFGSVMLMSTCAAFESAEPLLA